MKVLKFGGTSVANAERVLNVVDILESNSEQVAVVLSAPANITNHLVEMISKTVNKESIDELMQLTETIFENILLGLSKIESKFPYEPLRQLCLTEFDQLKTIFKGIALLTLCPDKINAQIISRGEKLSIAIMQGILEARGHKTVVIDPVKSLIAHGDYLESTVDIAESTRRIQALNIDERAIILMPGFTAGNEEGELVVLGRNGSDYSASVLAACLRADSCEIWTDVDGVYTCDPRFIPNARLLSSMSYQEAMELSYFGAKVLHPRTILPIAQFKIPCIIKNTQNPQAEGTYIGEGKVDLDNPVKGITHLNDMAMINVSGPGLKGMVGMSARVFSAMSLEGISVVLITQSSSEYSISFCVPQSQLNLAKEALKESFYLELKNGLLEPISVIENLSIISVIGDGMRTLKGVSANFFGALSQANINIIAIAQGSSERSISVVVEKNSAKVAVKATHQTLIEKIQVLEVFVMGVGGVGGALVDQIQRQQEWLLKKKIDLRVCGMFNSKQALFNADGLNLQDWREQLKSSKESYSINKIIEFVKANHLCNPIFVDCTSNQNIAESYLTLLSNGFHVVTPNKKANTDTMNYYRSLRAEAEKTRRKFLYDTNVGAGLPVIENLQNLINAGDELIHFSGILSGSLSFIFGLLDEGKTLSEATLLAKEKGFTEPDPRDDLSGMDVARKLLILAREVGLSLELSDIKVESVLPDEYSQGSTEEFLKKLPQLDAEFIERVNQAKAEGKVLRYVGVIEDGLCKVQINAVDENDPLYKIKNGENALAFFTRYYQPIPLVLRGYGAGNDVTAAGVFSDILRTVSAR